MKKIFILCIVVLSVTVLSTNAFTGTIQLPKTGQSKCYNYAGNEIVCTGTGQDGDIQAGIAWPDPRFSERADGTVSDNLTGLVWAKDANLMPARDPAFDTDSDYYNQPGTPNDGRVTWQHALDYVEKLNNEHYLGYSDWRLPNVNELESLVNDGRYEPALAAGNPFMNVQSFEYWSSTSYAHYAFYAWSVDIGYGGAYFEDTTLDFYVWPVRSGQCGVDDSVICLPKTGQIACYNESGANITCAGTGQDGELQAGVVWPDPRFIDHGDGTVADRLTGLEWTKNASLSGGSWQDMLDYVKTISIGGHSDWRLPNINELRSLVDYGRSDPALPLNYPFINVQTGFSAIAYWSSTSYAHGTGLAFTVTMNGGYVGLDSKVENYYGGYNYVWPVRAGQVDNSSTTTTTPPKPCAAEAIFGEQSEQTELLKKYRDEVLSKTAEGSEIIKIYYKFSPTITKLLESKPLLKNKAKMIIDNMLPGIRKKVEENNKSQHHK